MRRGYFMESRCVSPGADVKILKTFSPKNLAKQIGVFAQTTASFCKNLVITWVFEKSAIFAENCYKIEENFDPNIKKQHILIR
jgi:hypothetical protein